MSGEYSEPMTYRRLEEVLIDLGFEKTVGSNFVVYKNIRYGAVEILPHTNPEDELIPFHYLSVRQTLRIYGITTEQSLDERLNRPAQTSETVLKPAETQTVVSNRQYWAFVANPNRYRIADILGECENDRWRVNNHSVKAGDYAIIWKAKGRNAQRGLIAFAEVQSDPRVCLDLHPEYFIDATDGATLENRVDIRYSVPLGLPLWYDGDPNSLLGQLSCRRATGGTVFRVTPEQWSEINNLVDGNLGGLDAYEVDALFNEVDFAAEEGGLVLRQHRAHERNPALIRRKKSHALRVHERLSCEVCGFDFSKAYGIIGEGFIECHHTRPVSQMQVGEVTRLENLALVCSNCHKMLHRSRVALSIDDLRAKIREAT